MVISTLACQLGRYMIFFWNFTYCRMINAYWGNVVECLWLHFYCTYWSVKTLCLANGKYHFIMIKIKIKILHEVVNNGVEHTIINVTWNMPQHWWCLVLHAYLRTPNIVGISKVKIWIYMYWFIKNGAWYHLIVLLLLLPMLARMR